MGRDCELQGELPKADMLESGNCRSTVIFKSWLNALAGIANENMTRYVEAYEHDGGGRGREY